MPVISKEDDKITVFPFKRYDIVSDQFVVSKRLAKRRTIEIIGADIAGPSYLVPAEDVDSDGFTAIGYEPPEQ
jgi:hypothetical protein